MAIGIINSLRFIGLNLGNNINRQVWRGVVRADVTRVTDGRRTAPAMNEKMVPVISL
jgi:hypothetical protein